MHYEIDELLEWLKEAGVSENDVKAYLAENGYAKTSDWLYDTCIDDYWATDKIVAHFTL